MTHEELTSRVVTDPEVCGGQPCIRGTRIYIAIILDSLARGLTPGQIIEEYPQLTLDDIRGALAYAAELSRENLWKVPVTEPSPRGTGPR
jgi:uncharacterized protein (DUF433 family)